MLPATILKMQLPGQMMSFDVTKLFASVHITGDVRFCDGPGKLINM